MNTVGTLQSYCRSTIATTLTLGVLHSFWLQQGIRLTRCRAHMVTDRMAAQSEMVGGTASASDSGDLAH
jgi:hypothetical protein